MEEKNDISDADRSSISDGDDINRKKRAKIDHPMINLCQPKPDPQLQHIFDNIISTNIDEKEVIDLIKKNPSAAKAKYKVETIFGISLFYPIYIVIDNAASFEVVDTVYRAYPQAVRMCSEEDEPLLHLACARDASADVISLLLEEWPKAAMGKNGHGSSPLHCACLYQPPLEVVSLLVDKWPAAVEEKSDIKDTPLHVACRFNASLEVVSFLLDKFPEAAKDVEECGSTPLHLACSTEASVDVMSLLLQKNPEAIKQKDNGKKTPLHDACLHHSPFDVVSFLVEKWPAAVEQKDIFGDKPLDIWNRYPPNRHHENYDKVKNMLTDVNHLFMKDEGQSDALRIMENFIEMRWFGGIAIVLDICPSVVQKLEDITTSVIPYLLSFIGNRCRLLSMWNVINSRQDLLKIG